MTDASNELSARLPRDLVTELLAVARSAGADFAEVYGERAVHSGFSLDEHRIKTGSYSVLQGVGVRAIRGEQTGYAYADGFEASALREAARVASRIAREGSAAARASDGAAKPFRVVDAPAPFRLAQPAP